MKRSRGVRAGLAFLGAMLGVTVAGCSLSDEPELSVVEQGPPRLFDDGAGQRYFEVTVPEGQPRATIILIHGGGWVSHGPATFDASRQGVNQATADGFRVVAISTDQSPRIEDLGARADGQRVLDDVLAFHDQVRDAFGEEPVCTRGSSGGGHLSLMLAIERGDVDCAAVAAPPTDLIDFARDVGVAARPGEKCKEENVDEGFEFGACLAILTWGESESALRRASPALRWESVETDVWAGFESRDPVIPRSQRVSLRRAITDADIRVLESDPDGPGFAHGTVNAADSQQAQADLARWLDEVAPPVDGPAELPDSELRDGSHPACNSRLAPGPSWTRARRRDRSSLLDSHGRWQPGLTSRDLGAANSCDGREKLQNAGLMAWAPGYKEEGTRFVNQGESASWTFEAPDGSVAERLTSSFRGFIATPGAWRIGLYARGADSGWSAVAECDGRSCDGLEMQESDEGVTVVPAGTAANADTHANLPEQSWSLPSGTTDLRWRVECVARPGCTPRSINPGSDPASSNPRRAIDPTGRPAVLSLYELEVETVDD